MPLHDALAGAIVRVGSRERGGHAQRWARRIFLWAGVYGTIVLVPQYFMGVPSAAHAAGAALTHYGFVGVALAWQLAFLLIASDVARYRLFMLPAVAEKLAFAVPALVLCLQGRADAALAIAAGADLLLALLFAWAFCMVRSR